jgi:hypothetical protein
MRYHIGVFLVTLSVSVLAVREGVARGKSADDLDKKAIEIVKQAGALYKDAKAVHADFIIETTIGEGKEKRTMKVEGSYDLQRPNMVSVRSKDGGEKSPGLEFTSDGKTLSVAAKRLKQFAQNKAPDSMSELGQQLLGFGPPNVGMLFGNLMIDDPYETLMSGVTDCSYAGMEKINGVQTHHLKFKQPGFDWELFVAAEGKPFVLRMTNSRDDVKANTVETYTSWKIQDSMDKSTFAFTAPKDAKKVEEIDPRSLFDRDN